MLQIHDIHSIYCWRYAKCFFLQKTRTLFRNSFFPSTIIEWKNINHKRKNSAVFLQTAVSWKLSVSWELSDHLLSNGTFNSHNPKGIRFIVSLRLILVTFRSTSSGIVFNIYYTTFKWLVRCWFDFALSFPLTHAYNTVRHALQSARAP